MLTGLSFFFARYALIKAFFEVGAAEVLLSGGKKPSELADLLSLPEEDLKRFLDALVAEGILLREGGVYFLKPGLEEYFDPSTPFYLYPFIRHLGLLMDRWLKLPDLLKGGGVEGRGKKGEFFADLSKALFPVNWGSACLLAGALGTADSVLDVAAGSCVWSVPLALSGARVTALDFPEVIERAAKPVLSYMGVLDRYSFIASDMFETDWGAGYQYVILGHILHALGPERSKKALEKACGALRDGGKVVVVDFLKEISPFACVFDVNMLVNTSDGKVFCLSELEGMAREVGLTVDRTIMLDEGTGVAALILSPVE